MIHDESYCPPNTILVDYNRAGAPLLELVTEPAAMDATGVDDMLHEYRSLLRVLNISDANMEKGHFRVDVNVSLNVSPDTSDNPPVEIKNINSFRSIRQAVVSEIKRQREIIQRNGRIVRETRRFNENTGRSEPMRTKETHSDYRYFPEPDLPPIQISDGFLDQCRGKAGETPMDRRRWLTDTLHLPDEYSDYLALHTDSYAYFKACHVRLKDAMLAANWTMQVYQRLHAGKPETPARDIDATCRLLNRVKDGTITRSRAEAVYLKSIESGEPLDACIRAIEKTPIPDNVELTDTVRAVLDRYPDLVREYHSGKQNLFGFFMGRILEKSLRSADPVRVKEILEKLLKEP